MDIDDLSPRADRRAHQLWGAKLYDRPWDLTPRKAYVLQQREFQWKYHHEYPYSNGTWSWGWLGPDKSGRRPDQDGYVETPMTPRADRPCPLRRSGCRAPGERTAAYRHLQSQRSPCRPPLFTCTTGTRPPKATATRRTGSTRASSGITTTACSPPAE